MLIKNIIILIEAVHRKELRNTGYTGGMRIDQTRVIIGPRDIGQVIVTAKNECMVWIILENMFDR